MVPIASESPSNHQPLPIPARPLQRFDGQPFPYYARSYTSESVRLL